MAQSSLFNWDTIIPADAILKHSSLARALHLTLNYCKDKDGLELTQTGRLKRKYVDSLARSYDWPHYNIEEFYAVSKVMNADDFPPVILVQELLRYHKLVRRNKNMLKLTKMGQSLCRDISALYKMIIPAYLFEVNHMAFSRMRGRPIGNWDIWINVLHRAADTPARLDRLHTEFYGPTDKVNAYENQHELYRFYNGVIGPLMLSGLLHESRPANEGVETRLISKTPIWHLLRPF